MRKSIASVLSALILLNLTTVLSTPAHASEGAGHVRPNGGQDTSEMLKHCRELVELGVAKKCWRRTVIYAAPCKKRWRKYMAPCYVDLQRWSGWTLCTCSGPTITGGWSWSAPE